jgi:crossover junction endodeoxyribonuclease RuvC
MVILGVDPGVRFAGFSIIKKEGAMVYLLDYGYLAMPQSSALHHRVAMFNDFFVAKITQWQVTDLALEIPFMGKNAQNFLKLGYVRGILYLLASKYNLGLHEYAPTQIKQAVTGFGGADKEQIARIIYQLFPKLRATTRTDVTDAIAVTLCSLWKSKQSQRIKY